MGKTLANAAGNDRGSIVLLIAGLVLPLLFLLFSVSLDASRYFTETQKSQKLLDEAAIYSYRFLPFRAEAQAAAEAFLGRYSGMLPHTSIVVNGDSVSLLYSRASILSFPRFFGIEAAVPVTAYARVRGSPFDSIIMLDTSTYLGPAIPDGSPWDDALEWPASTFFENDFPLYKGGQALDPRLVTQQCFNSALLHMKRAAITAAEYLGHFDHNATGIGIFPGAGLPVTLLRDVASPFTRKIGPGEVDFEYYSASYNRNELCLAAAEHELISSKYQIPELNTKYGTPPAGSPMNITLPDPSQNTWVLNPQFYPYLEFRHSIWSLARKDIQIGNISDVLREVRARLLGAPYLEERGGLAPHAVKTAYIFAGDVPREDTHRFPEPGALDATIEQLTHIRNDVESSGGAISLKLIFVLFRHPGNDSSDLVSRVEALISLFAQQQLIGGFRDPGLEYQVVFTNSGEELIQNILGPLLSSRRTAVLSR